VTRKSNWLNDWVGDVQHGTRQCVDAALARTGVKLATFRPQFAQTTGCEISDNEFRDTCAEALAWVIVYATTHSGDGIDATWSELRSFRLSSSNCWLCYGRIAARA